MAEPDRTPGDPNDYTQADIDRYERTLPERYLDIENITHVEAAHGTGMTLCGLALEGVNGDTEMLKIDSRISCQDCLLVIVHVHAIPKSWLGRRNK